jgi:hypothetical protein
MFMFSTSSRLVLKQAQPPIQRGIAVLSTGLKRPGRETNHPPSCNANTENALSDTKSATRLEGK